MWYDEWMPMAQPDTYTAPSWTASAQETKLLQATVTDYRHSFPAWPDVAAHIPLAYVEGDESRESSWVVQ